MLKTFLAAMAVIVTSCAPAAANARTVCVGHEDVVEQLTAKYGEQRMFIGLHKDGFVMELFANPKTESWTVLLTRPNGVSCIVAAGEAGSLLDPETLPDLDSDPT